MTKSARFSGYAQRNDKLTVSIIVSLIAGLNSACGRHKTSFSNNSSLSLESKNLDTSRNADRSEIDPSETDSARNQSSAVLSQASQDNNSVVLDNQSGNINGSLGQTLEDPRSLDFFAKEVMKSCESSPKIAKVFPLEFAPQRKECIWQYTQEGEDYVQGYFRQSPLVAPVLPEGAVICSAVLKSANQNAQWIFDDEFYLTLSDRVLVASNSRQFKPYLEQFEGFHSFNFSKLKGVANDHGKSEDRYCFGLPSNSPGCAFPMTEERSAVNIDLPKASITRVSALVLQQKKIDWKLTITGDNDPDIDCKHSGLKLNWNVEYVAP